MEANYSLASQVEVGGITQPGLLLKSVHSKYRGQFRRWFGITAPTSLLAAAVLMLADQRAKAIFRNIPRLEVQFHSVEMVEAVALRFGSFFLSWFLGCFALAAIATAVNGLDAYDSDAVWKRDSHQRAREHFGALVLAALFTFCAFLAGIALAEFVELAGARLVGWSHFSRFIYDATLIGFVAVGGIVSWFGAAIPLIVKGNTQFWAALKKSLELSSGYEGSLFLLVVESLVGSYLAWYATFYGLRLLFPGSLRHTSWYGWVVNVIGVLAAAAVEPPIFIGFSLLADPERLNVSSLPVSQQAP